MAEASARHLTPREAMAAIQAVRDRHPGQRGDQDDASDGSGERVIAPADLDAIADQYEARETRWLEGA